MVRNFAPYKKRLEEEKGRLEENLTRLGRRNPLNPQEWEVIQEEGGPEPDENDAADRLEEYEESRVILKDLENRYRAVLAALERIDEGTYGICADIMKKKHAIEKSRLDADPAAQTCVRHINRGGEHV